VTKTRRDPSPAIILSAGVYGAVTGTVVQPQRSASVAEVSLGRGGSPKRDSGAVVSGAVSCGAPESRLPETAVMLPSAGSRHRLRPLGRCRFGWASRWWPVMP
jgi:hypothetical protein